jgi:hypothetical protein
MLVFKKKRQAGTRTITRPYLMELTTEWMQIYHSNRCDYKTESRAYGRLYLQQEEKPARGTALQ